jgi:hypothetical protein
LGKRDLELLRKELKGVGQQERDNRKAVPVPSYFQGLKGIASYVRFSPWFVE